MAGGAKEHVEKVRTSKFNRQMEKDVLRSNCGGEGYVFCNLATDGSTNAAGRSQFHHVLPISSLQDAQITYPEKGEEIDFIHKCMAITTWDINEQPNLLGLPSKLPYEDADRRIGKGMSAAALLALDPKLS